MTLPKSVAIISPESWGTNFVSKHHYAHTLAKNGVSVYFINPPINKNIGAEILQSELENIKIVNYTKPLSGINQLPLFLANKIWARKAKKILSLIGKVDWIWSFDPYVFQNLSVFGENLTKIYHTVDVHHTTKEFDCVKNADHVFGSSHKILEKFSYDRKNLKSNVFDTPMRMINHGLSDHFLDINENKNQNEIPDKGKYTKKVGYVGNLNYRFLDYPTLLDIVSQNPSIGFYFIGSFEGGNLGEAYNEDKISTLRSFKNTYLLGAVPSKELPALINQCDLFLMCYKVDQHIAEMANPHKLLEYFSTGKVVVSHYIDEYQDKKNILEFVRDNNNLPKTFLHVINNLDQFNSKTLQQKRINFAKKNSYTNQLKAICDIVFS